MGRNYLKRVLTVFISLILIVFAFTACSEEVPSSSDDGKLNVVVTIFPEYDWAREIIGDRADDVDLTLLLDNGADLHSYQPSAEDIMKIANADVFVYVGGESDEWVDEVLEKTAGGNVKTINLMDTIGDLAKEEEIVEGMQDEDGHEHDEDDHDEDHDEDHDDDPEYDEDQDEDIEDHEDNHDEDPGDNPEYDEHVWLSLKNAEVIVDKMAEAFADADSANAQTYKENGDKYIEKLKNLDNKYENTVKSAKGDTILFGDRFPFRYMTDDYGLKYYAAFVGCSAETEASFETVTFLANKVDELGLKYLMVIDGSDGKIAETIIKNTTDKNQGILRLDSMQSIGLKEIESGKTYYDIMRSNLKVLKKALS